MRVTFSGLVIGAVLIASGWQHGAALARLDLLEQRLAETQVLVLTMRAQLPVGGQEIAQTCPNCGTVNGDRRGRCRECGSTLKKAGASRK